MLCIYIQYLEAISYDFPINEISQVFAAIFLIKLLWDQSVCQFTHKYKLLLFDDYYASSLIIRRRKRRSSTSSANNNSIKDSASAYIPIIVNDHDDDKATNQPEHDAIQIGIQRNSII
jgi:hypothetical protein